MQRQMVFEPLIVPVFEDRTHQWLSYFEASRLFAEKVARERMGHSATYPQPHGYPVQPDPAQPYPSHNQTPVGGYGQPQAPPYNPHAYQQQPNPYPQPYAYPPAQLPGQYQPPTNYGQPPNPAAQQPGYYPPAPHSNAWGQVSYPSQPYAAPPVSGYPPQPAASQYPPYPATTAMPQPQVYQYPSYDQSTNYNYGISDQKPVEKSSNKPHQLDEKITRASYHVHAAPPSAKPELDQKNLSNFLDEDIKTDSSQYEYTTEHYYNRPPSSHTRRTITEPSVVERHYERNAYAPGIGAIGWNI